MLKTGYSNVPLLELFVYVPTNYNNLTLINAINVEVGSFELFCLRVYVTSNLKKTNVLNVIQKFWVKALDLMIKRSRFKITVQVETSLCFKSTFECFSIENVEQAYRVVLS